MMSGKLILQDVCLIEEVSLLKVSFTHGVKYSSIKYSSIKSPNTKLVIF
jgi:hypothetical protein